MQMALRFAMLTILASARAALQLPVGPSVPSSAVRARQVAARAGFAKSTPSTTRAQRMKRASETKWNRPSWLPEVDNNQGEEISDGATAIRWIGVQGSIDVSGAPGS